MLTLMNKGKEVLTFEYTNNLIDKVTVINKDLLPEMLKSPNAVTLNEWLTARSVDLSRPTARLLLTILNVDLNTLSSTLYNRAANLTDTFWIKNHKGELYSNFCLYRTQNNTSIQEVILNGTPNKVPQGINTELTNIGSLTKIWYKTNNKWFLLKRASTHEIYAELFTYHLGVSLGMNIVKYFIKDNMIASPNFTNESKNLEHYFSFKYKFKDKSIEDTVIAENMKSVNLFEKYTDILLLDGIVCNPDRHEFNFGVLKNPSTGSIIDLAPNFDNNLSLGVNSSLSTYLLRQYLKDFGVLPHQKKYINKLSKGLLASIDTRVKKEMKAPTLNTSNIESYFLQVLNILNITK